MKFFKFLGLAALCSLSFSALAQDTIVIRGAGGIGHLEQTKAVKAQGSCAKGQIQTQYGCLNQAPCPLGYGAYSNSNSCVISTAQAIKNALYQGGCADGQVQTQYGCLISEPRCGEGAGLFNSMCVHALYGEPDPNGYTNQGQYPSGYGYYSQHGDGKPQGYYYGYSN